VNGGVLGNDAKVIFKHNNAADLTGIDDHELNSLPMVDATTKTKDLLSLLFGTVHVMVTQLDRSNGFRMKHTTLL